MAAMPKPRVLSQRGKSSLEVERENFEKTQTASVMKALSQQETPAKEKHVRIALLGTHKEAGAALFWNIVMKLPLQGNPIVCWKFCHVLHKLMREGHPNVIRDSQRYPGYILDLGKLWGHLREGYGRLIAAYSKLLVQKLTFHKKYPEIPGSLNISEEKLEQICNNDINSYYELSVDLLDYMDEILSLQAQVFGSLDMSRSNSMTATGQCRLAPVIMCVQESALLYDYIVKFLFKLHASLPADMLCGHRDRFNQQFKSLKTFYYNSANLQYFKHLVQVPSLPDEPPNFLVASDLSTYVTPVVVVPEHMELTTPEVENVDMLVDTSSVASDEPPRMEDLLGPQNGAPSPPVPDERDRFIEQLMKEINELKQELSRLRNEKAEDQMLIESLSNRLRELELEIEEMKQIAEQTTHENALLRPSLQDTEKQAQVSEDKYKKMRDIYQKLRDEHVTLLRKGAETNKQLSVAKIARDEALEEKRALEQQLEEIRIERTRVEASLVQASASSETQLETARRAREEAEKAKDELEARLKELEGGQQDLEGNLAQYQADMDGLREAQQRAAQEKKEVEEQLEMARLAREETEKAKGELEARLSELEGGKLDLEGKFAQCQTDIDGLRGALQKAADDRKETEEKLRQQMLEMQRKLLEKACEEGEAIIQDSMDQLDNPQHSAVTCTAEYLLSRTEPVLDSLDQLRGAYTFYNADPTAVGSVIQHVCDFAHRLGETIVQGKATSNSQSDIEKGEELSNACKETGEESLKLLACIKQGSTDEIESQASKVEELVKKIVAHTTELMPKVEDVKAEEMGDLVDQEMQQTTEAIEKAAAKIAEMLASSLDSQSGIQLEVNEQILKSCTSLMMAIKVLIQRSKVLQREIVSQGRGTHSAKDFYKKHHRWTEGLLSAAKAVGWGANVLVEAADKVVKGEGKFEELVVCSQEIAASTAQLVVASKVKADRKSENLHALSEASKGVSEATGTVVASAKSGAQRIEDADIFDFSKLTLHQAKRMEMEAQVRVLELESDLEKERRKLSDLRKQHYQLAGEAEGWSQDEDEEYDYGTEL